MLAHRICKGLQGGGRRLLLFTGHFEGNPTSHPDHAQLARERSPRSAANTRGMQRLACVQRMGHWVRTCLVCSSQLCAGEAALHNAPSARKSWRLPIADSINKAILVAALANAISCKKRGRAATVAGSYQTSPNSTTRNLGVVRSTWVRPNLIQLASTLLRHSHLMQV